MPSLKIDPRKQIRWQGDVVPASGDIPITSLPAHHVHHELGGVDQVLLDATQVVGLSEFLSEIGTVIHSNTPETITGVWEFTDDVFFDDTLTVNTLVEVVSFQAILRPDNLSVGDVYRDAIDKKLYYTFEGGTRAFVLEPYATPTTRIKMGLAQAFIAGLTHVGVSHVLAMIAPHMGFGQAVGQIRRVQSITANAQAKISNHIWAGGHAQARIKNPAVRGFAQAQALLNFRAGFGQSQGYILAPYPNIEFSQAQAKIRAFGQTGVGYATAVIT